MNKTTLERIVKILDHLVSDDVTRHHLGHVAVTKVNDEQVLLSACDGHILGDVKIADDDLAIAAPCFIHRDMLPFLRLTLKESPRLANTIEAQVSPGSILINGRAITATDVNYPNLEAIRPKFEGAFQIAFDVELLMSLVKGLNGDKRHHAHLVIGNDRLGPVKVFVGENQGVLMPIRSDSKLPKSSEATK